MSGNMINVPLEDYQSKCRAEAELEIVKRYLVVNSQYDIYKELRALLGMEVKCDD